MTGAATLVLRGGRVRTPGGFSEALAATGERITAVGTVDDVAGLIGPSTRVIDLRGRLAIPAFGDAHIHAVSGGLESLRCDLTGLRSRAGYLEAIAAHAAGLDPDAWVLGGGWSMEAFPGGVPTASDLDTVCGGRPALLPNRDHHSAWVNSAALGRAGIDAGTPDPPDGRIERDPDGTPTGTLHEGAMTLVARIAPTPSGADLLDGLRVAQSRLHSLGITH